MDGGIHIKLPDWPRTANEGQESQHREQPQTDTGTREFIHLSDVEVSIDTSSKGILIYDSYACFKGENPSKPLIELSG